MVWGERSSEQHSGAGWSMPWPPSPLYLPSDLLPPFSSMTHLDNQEGAQDSKGRWEIADASTPAPRAEPPHPDTYRRDSGEEESF